MVSTSDIKFYKSNNNGLGGAINTSDPVTSGSVNNIFPYLTRAEILAESTRYICIYIKNTSVETIRNLEFWKSSGSGGDFTTMDWANGTSGKNESEQTIADIYTAPTGVVWRGTNNVDKITTEFEQDDYYALWFRSTVTADAPTLKNNEDVFKFKITIPATSVGSDPEPDPDDGGTGGNPSPSVTDWKIAVVADMDGTKSACEDVFDIMDDDNKFILCGDYAYGDPDAWIDLANQHSTKGKTIGFAMGNHEEDDGYGDFCNWYGISTSKTWFYRKWENVCVITVDSNINMDSGTNQHDDVEQWIDDANNDANVDWIFMCMHHPWFGSGSDHGYNEGDSVQAFHDLMSDSKKGMFVFTGHNHNWQRTNKVTYNSGDPENPNVNDSSSPFTNDANGIIHVVSGTGGHDSGSSLYPLDDNIGEGDNPNAYQNRSHNGIYELVASNDGKTLTCRFKSTNGDTFDTITVTTT